MPPRFRGRSKVPISDVVALAADATPNDLQRAVVAVGHSRYGIHDAGGEPTGYLHLKDVMDLTGTKAAEQPIPAKRIRRLPTVYHDSVGFPPNREGLS